MSQKELLREPDWIHWWNLKLRPCLEGAGFKHHILVMSQKPRSAGGRGLGFQRLMWGCSLSVS